MRKVTREIVQSWARGESRTIGNTSTDGDTIWLHGNPIAWKTGDADVIALTWQVGHCDHSRAAQWRSELLRDRLPIRSTQLGASAIIERDVIEIYGEHEIVYFNIETGNALTSATFAGRSPDSATVNQSRQPKARHRAGFFSPVVNQAASRRAALPAKRTESRDPRITGHWLSSSFGVAGDRIGGAWRAIQSSGSRPADRERRSGNR
jgi:hypothetical protein